MFVPIHHIHRSRGKSPQVKIKAVLGAVVGALVTGVLSRVLHGGGPKAVVLALALGLGSAALGIALARRIGRQGRI